MSLLVKALFAILFLAFVALGIEGFLYFQVQKGSLGQLIGKSVPQPTNLAVPTGTPSTTVEMKGRLVLVQNLNLVDIGKPQVLEWAKTPGPIDIPAYLGPLPTLPPEIRLSQNIPTESATFRTTSVKILAGFFKGLTQDGISVSQTSTSAATIKFTYRSRLWIKDQNTIKLAVQTLEQMLISRYLDKVISTNDLLLVTVAEEQGGVFTSNDLIVFK